MLKNYSSEYESKMLTSDKVHVTGLELGMMRRESQKDVEGLKRLLLERKPVINHLQNNPCTQLVGKWRGKGDDVHFFSLVCVQFTTNAIRHLCLPATEFFGLCSIIESIFDILEAETTGEDNWRDILANILYMFSKYIESYPVFTARYHFYRGKEHYVVHRNARDGKKEFREAITFSSESGLNFEVEFIKRGVEKYCLTAAETLKEGCHLPCLKRGRRTSASSSFIDIAGLTAHLEIIRSESFGNSLCSVSLELEDMWGEDLIGEVIHEAKAIARDGIKEDCAKKISQGSAALLWCCLSMYGI